MSKSYIDLNRPIKDISTEELIEKLEILKNKKGKYIISQLMRTIILNEKQFINIDYNRSLRGFWYSTVKPTLDKLGLLTEKDQTEEGLKKWDGELSRYLAELVKEGELSYKDLKIVDTSRQRETPSEKYSVTELETYGYKTTIAEYPNIIISTEKDTVFNIIKDIASILGCSCISGKGQNSLGAMEDLLRNMGQVTSDIYILTLTDYDPSGYYIAETFKNQVEDLRKILKIENNVHIERIGINPDQLTDIEVEQNKYTPKPNNLEKWMNITNGINGEPKGLELDALTPNRIRSIFVTSLKKYINPELYKTFIKDSYIQKVVLESLEPMINNIIQEVVKKQSKDISTIDFDLFDLVEAGHSYLPIQSLCYSDNNDYAIKQQVLSYFK